MNYEIVWMDEEHNILATTYAIDDECTLASVMEACVADIIDGNGPDGAAQITILIHDV